MAPKLTTTPKKLGPIGTAELTFNQAKELAVCYHYGYMGNTYFYSTEPMAEAAGIAFQREARRREEGTKSSGRQVELDRKHAYYGQLYAAYFWDY
jgi:hypothetical protein